MVSSICAAAGPSAPASKTGTSAISGSASSDPERIASAVSGAAASRRRPALRIRGSANGITASDANGATAIPSPTTPIPEPIPTATASGNRNREVDSRNTSPPYSAKY